MTMSEEIKAALLQFLKLYTNKSVTPNKKKSVIITSLILS